MLNTMMPCHVSFIETEEREISIWLSPQTFTPVLLTVVTGWLHTVSRRKQTYRKDVITMAEKKLEKIGNY